MDNQSYEEIYKSIKTWLYDMTWGLGINYNENVENRDMLMATNLETLKFMQSSLENEKTIIDAIISQGVALAQSNQYIVNAENLERFLNYSTVVPMARSAYQNVINSNKKR